MSAIELLSLREDSVSNKRTLCFTWDDQATLDKIVGLAICREWRIRLVFKTFVVFAMNTYLTVGFEKRGRDSRVCVLVLPLLLCAIIFQHPKACFLTMCVNIFLSFKGLLPE